MQYSYTDHSELTQAWNSQLCVSGRLTKHRLAVFRTLGVGLCINSLESIDRLTVLLAYWPCPYYRLDQVESTFDCQTTGEEDLNRALEYGNKVALIDLSINKVVVGSWIKDWQRDTRTLVQVIGDQAETPFNYYQFVDEITKGRDAMRRTGVSITDVLEAEAASVNKETGIYG